MCWNKLRDDEGCFFWWFMKRWYGAQRPIVSFSSEDVVTLRFALRKWKRHISGPPLVNFLHTIVSQISRSGSHLIRKLSEFSISRRASLRFARFLRKKCPWDIEKWWFRNRHWATFYDAVDLNLIVFQSGSMARGYRSIFYLFPWSKEHWIKVPRKTHLARVSCTEISNLISIRPCTGSGGARWPCHTVGLRN